MSHLILKHPSYHPFDYGFHRNIPSEVAGLSKQELTTLSNARNVKQKRSFAYAARGKEDLTARWNNKYPQNVLRPPAKWITCFALQPGGKGNTMLFAEAPWNGSMLTEYEGVRTQLKRLTAFFHANKVSRNLVEAEDPLAAKLLRKVGSQLRISYGSCKNGQGIPTSVPGIVNDFRRVVLSAVEGTAVCTTTMQQVAHRQQQRDEWISTQFDNQTNRLAQKLLNATKALETFRERKKLAAREMAVEIMEIRGIYTHEEDVLPTIKPLSFVPLGRRK